MIESLMNGVPMIAWPLHAEQKMNAAMLIEELGMVIRSTILPTKKLVTREEIQEMVRIFMQTKKGKSIRENAKKLKMSAKNALSEGGLSLSNGRVDPTQTTNQTWPGHPKGCKF